MKNEHVEINLTGFKQFEKVFKNIPTVRVGILGTKDERTKGDVASNATVGVQHEFGTENVPQRSFLHMPLSMRLMKELEARGAFTLDAIFKASEAKSPVPFMKKLGVAAVAVVKDAFNTGGFGLWKPSNMDRKNVHQTLVETGQLQRAITYDVVQE